MRERESGVERADAGEEEADEAPPAPPSVSAAGEPAGGSRGQERAQAAEG